MSEELIKRSDAIKAVKKRKAKIVCNYESDKWFNKMVSEIEAIPSADRPQGEWIYHTDDLFPAESTQECNICHEEEFISLCNENFCPNCGADMKGADDGRNAD